MFGDDYLLVNFQKYLSWPDTKQRWKELHGNPELRSRLLGPEFLDSWERCNQFNVPRFKTMVTSFCSETEFKEACDSSEYLLETAIPVMEALLAFVNGTGFVVTLNDVNCTCLKMMGDENALAWAKQSGVIEGSIWSEQEAGTNGLPLCISLVKPITITSYEHFCLFATPASGSFAPIVDQGNLMGAIGLVAPYQYVSFHTLGMVVGAAQRIESTMTLNRFAKHQQAITESISDGVMVFDLDGTITDINIKCSNILELDSTNIIGSNISNFFGKDPRNQHFINFVNQRWNATDEICILHMGKNDIRCFVTCTHMKGSNSKDLGSVVVFREAERVQSMVGKWMGRTAKMTFDDIIGKSEQFQQVMHSAKKAALSNSNVLLQGESGTGKDILAQAIHNQSSRRRGPFLAINCGAIPRELIASELFGYEDGAFTGAKKGGNIGKFELANHGTLFLDEIGDIPIDLQVSLLRVLEERCVTRIGGKRIIPLNIRIIAATNKNLEEAMANGIFRRDLYYRLGVIKFSIPALRERREDIPLLLEHFLQIICHRFDKPLKILTPTSLEMLVNYEWIGNIRELQNVLEGAVQLTNGEYIDDAFIKKSLGLENQIGLPIGDGNDSAVFTDEQEQELIILENLLKANKFNKSKTAKALGISRPVLYKRLKKYNLI